MRKLSTLTRRYEDLRGRAELRHALNGGDVDSPALLGQVMNGNGGMPQSVPGQFLVQPVYLPGVPNGVPTEGSAPTFGADGVPELVTVLGPGVPRAGDVLLARLVGSRWVAEFGKSGGKCDCRCVPKVLTLRSDWAPTDAAGAVVAGPFANGLVEFPVTLTWGPPPVDRALLAPGDSGLTNSGGTLGGGGGGSGGGTGPTTPFGFYMQFPEASWWSDTMQAGPNTFAFWLYVSGCAVNVVPVFLGTVGVPSTPDTSGLPTFPAIVSFQAGYVFFSGLGNKDNDCDPLHLKVWSYLSRTLSFVNTTTTLGTDKIDVTGDRYESDCVNLDDETDSAGAGTIKLLGT